MQFQFELAPFFFGVGHDLVDEVAQGCCGFISYDIVGMPRWVGVEDRYGDG